MYSDPREGQAQSKGEGNPLGKEYIGFGAMSSGFSAETALPKRAHDVVTEKLGLGEAWFGAQ